MSINTLYRFMDALVVHNMQPIFHFHLVATPIRNYISNAYYGRRIEVYVDHCM